MTGKVVLTKGKDVMRGTQLTVNLDHRPGDAGRRRQGARRRRSNGGRVQGIFTPQLPTGGN